MHCIVDTRWQKPGIVPPMVYLQLETSVKCDLSQQCFAPSAEQKDIYWAAHNSALIRDHQLYPQPCACVINVVSPTADDLCDFISAFVLPYVLQFILFEFQESTISTISVMFHCHTFDVSIDAKHNIHTFCPCTWWFVNIVCCGAESVSRSLLICALRLCLYLRADILCMFICQPQRLYKPVSSWGLSTKLATTNDVKLWTISPFQASKVQKPAWPVFLFCFVWL